MFNPDELADNLTLNSEGYWEAARASTHVSYPSYGNRNILSIEEGSFWYKHRTSVILEAARRYMNADEILDIGGGNGIVSEALQKMGFNVCLVEPMRERARHALRHRGLKTVICAAFQDIDFRPRSVSAAGVFDVLEHIEDDGQFLCSLNTSLVPGGELILTVPALNFLYSSFDRHVGHFRRYGLSRLEKTLLDCRFQVLYSTYFFSVFPPAVFLGRTLPGWLGFKSGVTPKSKKRMHTIHHLGPWRFIQWLLGAEMSLMRLGRRLPFGSSILVVARKV
jgi:SAM-dependent methyltransferase